MYVWYVWYYLLEQSINQFYQNTIECLLVKLWIVVEVNAYFVKTLYARYRSFCSPTMKDPIQIICIGLLGSLFYTNHDTFFRVFISAANIFLLVFPRRILRFFLYLLSVFIIGISS